MNRQTIAVLALALTACAVPEKSRMSDAATTPLSDLNLVHASIPAVLVDAQKRPYVAPADQSCTALAAEVRALDEVLGPDLDAPASASNPGLIERGSDRKSTRLNSSHGYISYAVFCLKKKKR